MQKLDKKILKEEKFLIEILFSQKKSLIKEIDLKIDFNLLVKIASSHLMLPALFINLKKKKLINSIPLELKIYLKEIYSLNKERNEAGLGEIKEISKKLIDNNINHVFLKGSSHLLNGIYSDIGERMIGDIDFLVSKKDIIKATNLIKTINYKESKYAFIKTRHYHRLINPKKIFALEIHDKLISSNKKKLLNPELILENRVFSNKKYFIPNVKDEILYNIYNYQINDQGSAKLSYSYRSFYDTFMLMNHYKYNLNEIKTDKHINNYFMIIRELKIPEMEIKKIEIRKINLYIFRIKYINKFFFNFFNLISSSYDKRDLRKKQIFKLFKDKKYFKYLIKKKFGEL